MKANELRIGNLVDCLEGIGKVTQIQDIDVLVVDEIGYVMDVIQPIPLTEEWAQKFKCEIVDGDVNDEWGGMKEYIFNDFYELSFFNSQVYLHCFNMCEEVEYVHQLQNLYFALTGKELVINETIK